MQQQKFLKKLFVFTLTLGLVIGLVQNMQHRFVLGNLVWAELAYYFVLAFVTGMITQSGMEKNNKTFMTRTYSAIGIRLVFSVFPLLIYLLFGHGRDMPLIITYILLYFLYTSFEIYFLVVNLRPNSEK